MTVTTPRSRAEDVEVAHPLDPLTASDVTRARAVLESTGRLAPSTRFASLLLREPAKDTVRRHRPGDAVPRRVEATLLDVATGAIAEVLVDFDGARVESWTDVDPTEAPYGQPPVLFEEYDRCADLIKADPHWQAAMARRGVTDTSLTFVAPLSPGFFDVPREKGRRVLRGLTFLRDHVEDSPWAHPVEGLIADVDVISSEVLCVEDAGDVPVPAADGNFDPASVGPARTTLKPIEITQPEGPSFTVAGSLVRWENWELRVGFNAREGLTLHQVGFTTDGETLPVLYRASVPEMVVPYGDPSPFRHWISYFDAGEYLLGKNANSLRLGCDCLGVIHYLDAVVADDHGRPVRIPQAICMHEEDYGILWKHTNVLTGAVETRRSRRFVVSFFATIGNYDYGFFWYFYLDGSIELEVKATGIVFTAGGHPGTANPHASEIARGLFAPFHQHLFCARLDVEIAGSGNSVHEIDMVGVPTGPDNPHGNAFTTRTTPLRSESEAVRMADPAVGRVWRISNPSTRNAVGAPRAYHLHPHPGPTLLAQPEATVAQRAAFARRHLWITRFDESERYPAGERPNQHSGGAGLPAWTAADRSIVDTDVVLWHVFGPTHVPRPEDWPVMPVDYSGFSLKPSGFCDRNPALDLPGGTSAACHDRAT
ncbi:primary-amine oxidase [Pseudonocardia sp. DSM 110487]|uniref:primary-amine oxidase n=1 Tax=Pseudonocardia sp. DSM 110487 TaxID=2865833 RepID=UPI001C694AD3|nr:primary-amine oxidase [Pseudonocardia sp. DSM 110487]QYN33711.1 primary-amine oxidase [Pseudonocardia sp. DSM 110487]